MIAAVCAALLWAVASAQVSDSESAGEFVIPNPLIVGTKVFEPFVFIEEQTFTELGEFEGARPTGFSIELMDMIAERLRVTVEYRRSRNGTLANMLRQTAAGEFNASIAGTTITQAREEFLDFSHMFFRSGIGILVPTPETRSPLSVAWSPVFWNAICVVLLLSYIFSVLVWCAEHRTNPDFQPKGFDPEDPDKLGRVYVIFEGLWQALWFSVVTVTTIGYGDKTPRTKSGRMFTLVWMFIGLALFGVTAGTVSSELTASRAVSSISTAADLNNQLVAAVDGSTGAEFAKQQNAQVRAVDNVDEAYDLLERELVKAVVSDYPVLVNFAKTANAFYVLPAIYRRESYGISFPIDSPLREVVNLALLGIMESADYTELLEQYGFSRDGGSLGASTVDDSSDLSWSDPSSVSIVIVTAVIALLHAIVLCWLAVKDRSLKDLINSAPKFRRRFRFNSSKGDYEVEDPDNLVGTNDSGMQDTLSRRASVMPTADEIPAAVIMKRLDAMHRSIEEVKNESRRSSRRHHRKSVRMSKPLDAQHEE